MTDVTATPPQLPVLATTVCPSCAVVVPDARYCGACGADLTREGFRSSQRMHSFAAFPDEPVLRLSAVTSLFPHLSHRAKAPFRLALALIVALLVVFAFAGTSAPLIAVCALGVPLLFLLYIWEVDPYEGSFGVPTSIALVLGAGFGLGWALLGKGYVDQALQPSLAGGITPVHSLQAAVAVPVVGQLLMCVPVIVVWFLQRGERESLDGFVAGATGALGFTMAATVVLMAPWFTSGQLVHQSFTAVLAQAVVRGISLPLVSALLTGLFGAALWVTTGRRATAAKGRWLSSPVVALVLALLVQIGLGFVDIGSLSAIVLIVVHLVAVALALVLARIGIHHVLIHEALDVSVGPPSACAHCRHLVPAMAFCPQCGVARRAIARTHRTGRPPSAPGSGPEAATPGGVQ